MIEMIDLMGYVIGAVFIALMLIAGSLLAVCGFGLLVVAVKDLMQIVRSIR